MVWRVNDYKFGIIRYYVENGRYCVTRDGIVVATIKLDDAQAEVHWRDDTFTTSSWMTAIELVDYLERGYDDYKRSSC
jgi:hypothetical protein